MYSYAFAALWFLLISLGSLAPRAVWEPIGAALALAPAVHMFFHVHGAYGLRWFSALWRTAVLLIFSAMVLGLFAAAVVFIGIVLDA